MNHSFPIAYLARHGETAWTLTGQHTGRTDLPLTERGEWNARRLGDRLVGMTFAQIFSSPLQRARRTCELAGFSGTAKIDDDLVEWNYGDYEGRTRTQILAERPDWNLFRDGCPGGESPEHIAARADRVVQRIRAAGGNVLLFSSGHILRVLATRWIETNITCAASLMLSTASLSTLTFEGTLTQPTIGLWNNVDFLSERWRINAPDDDAAVNQPAA